MDDNKKNQEENQSIPVETVTESPDSFQTQPPVEEPTPVFDSVTSEEPTVPEEVASDVTNAASESIEENPELPPEMPPPAYDEGKNKYMIIIAGVVIFFIFLVLIMKVFFGGTAKPKAVALTYWGLWEDREIMKPLIDLYQQKYPNVKVDYQKMTPQDYRDKLLARSKNGQGPDIFRFHNTWLPEIRDVASPIPSSIMTSADFEKTFYKIHQNDLKDTSNRYYGIPLMIDGLVLIYNDDLLKKAGIQTPPASWDELPNVLDKLTSKDKSGQFINTAIAMGTTSNVEHYSDIFSLLLVQNGGKPTNLDTPEAAGALEVYRKFAEPQNEFWNDTMPNSMTAFIQEKVAMIIAPSWVVINIKAANPEIKVKVAPVPVGPDGNPISIANYWVEGVSKTSKNQLEAWKFLHFLVQKDNLTKLYEIQAQVRPFGEPYSRVDLAELLKTNEYLAPIMKESEYFVSVPFISRTFDNGLNDESIKYIENAINATSQGVSYAEALKTAQLGIAETFKKYNISLPTNTTK